ncbi:MAG: M28 family peptidase [Magnetococcales bacterium]|nr:M28 family peptidase [Magnetococcales bacterium]
MPGISHSGSQPALSSAEKITMERLKRDVAILAFEIGERNIWYKDELKAAAQYINGEFIKAGYSPQSQHYTARGVEVENIYAIKPGNSKADEVVVVGGHYDSVLGSPGANDNASGTAAVLELARLLADKPLAKTIHFVTFVNEEPPFFKKSDMGSLVYAKELNKRGVKVSAMLSLETIGYYSQKPSSQRFPFPLGFFYPETGNFIGFVANTSSKGLLEQAISTFRATTPFPSEGVAAPAWVMGIDWSDQWAFWKQGYPALMITDTAPYRYPQYHSATDLPDKISYESYSRVVTGLGSVVTDLANR